MLKIGIFEDVKKAVGADVPDLDAYYGMTEKCRRIYAGEPDWRRVKKGGLYHAGSRTIAMLNTAKVLCDRFAVLLFAEEPEIIFSSGKCDEFVRGVIEKSNLFGRMGELLSAAYAMGGAVFRPYINNGEIDIDCVYGDGFLPLSWTPAEIDGGCFRSVIFRKGHYYTLFEIHSCENGVPSVEYRLFKSRTGSDIGSECGLSEAYPMLKEKTVFYGMGKNAAFSCFKPSGANNIYPDVPMGISVFANCTDTLKALDVAFDSFTREFVLGRKRIIVPSSCVQTVVDISTGEQRQYFDADDEAYVALKCDEERDLKITDNTVELRVDEHIKAINALLDILCFQTGLSAGTFSFNQTEGVKTATEIISRDSRTAALIRADQNNLSRALVKLFKAVIALGVYTGKLDEGELECDVTVSWHDGIVTDENTAIDNCIKLVNSGLKSKVTAIAELKKCSYEAALEEYNRILKEEKI